MQQSPARSRRRCITSGEVRLRPRALGRRRAPARRLGERAGCFLRRGGSLRSGAPKMRSASIRPPDSTLGRAPLPGTKRPVWFGPELPLNVPSSPLGRAKFASNLKAVMEQAIASARVLVVEDDEAIADVLRRSLRAEGHEVRSAGDGAEALTAAEQFSPDLIVLDLGLPRLDGMEVCRRIRAES